MDKDTEAVMNATKLLHPDYELDPRLAEAFAKAIRDVLGLEEGSLNLIVDDPDYNNNPYFKSIAQILGHRTIN